MDEKRVAFWANIPATVLYDDQIPASAKLLYGEISTLTEYVDRSGHCDATNAELATPNGWSEDTVSRLIKALEKRGHIETRYTPAADGHPVRMIFMVLKPPLIGKNADELIGKNADTLSAKKPMSTLLLNNKKRGRKEKSAAARAEIDEFFREQYGQYGELLDALELFLDARAEKGNPMPSLIAAKALKRKLDLYAADNGEFNPHIAYSCLLYSSEHGYPSVYPPKDDVIRSARARMQPAAVSESDTAVDLGGMHFV